MPVGKTRDAGWEIGVSRTLDHPIDEVWTFLVEHPGVWLGRGAELPVEPHQRWLSSAGATGELRTRHESDRMRLTLRQPNNFHETIVQVTVRPAGSRTRLGFHQERMLSDNERTRQRAHWQTVIDRIASQLKD